MQVPLNVGLADDMLGAELAWLSQEQLTCMAAWRKHAVHEPMGRDCPEL